MATQKSQQKSQKSKQDEANKAAAAPQAEEPQLEGEPEKRAVGESEKVVESRLVGAAGLSVILGQLVAYFTGRAGADDLEVLNFSLPHLFGRIDYLYCSAFPELMQAKTIAQTEPPLLGEILRRQYTWNTLRAIKNAINRMEPLCHLLNNAVEYILDALDQTDRAIPSEEQGDEEAKPPFAVPKGGYDWLQSLNQERWNHALVTLTERLGCWQHSYNELTPFAVQFANIIATVPSLVQLDESFSVLLDCAGAIFGDILPSSQALSVTDDDAVVTLLFDLMQQSDQILVQFDTVHEPLQTLLEYFAPTDMSTAMGKS